MNNKSFFELLEKWGKVIGVFVGVGAIVAHAINYPIFSYLLTTASWLFVSIWLWGIWRQKRLVRNIILRGETKTLPKTYSDKQRWLALASLMVISSGVWVWLGWNVWQKFQPHPTPDLTIFPQDKIGVIIAEFTLGQEERNIFPGGIELRDKIFTDLRRSLSQQMLSNRVVIQQAGPIKNQEEATKLGEKYGAELVVWGYVPISQPNSFRPNFTILLEPGRQLISDPALFAADIIGGDTIEANNLLTKHIRAISNFLIGLIYLRSENIEDIRASYSLLTEAIDFMESEYTANAEMKHDIAFNLAMFYLLRGRTQAALGKDDEAITDYQKALEFAPKFTRPYLAIGNVYYNKRDFATAATYYEKATSSWLGHYGLGLIAYHEGRYEESVQYLAHALEMFQPEVLVNGEAMDTKLRFVLGMAYKRMGDWKNAESFLWEACHTGDLYSATSDIQKSACWELTPPATSTSTIAPTTSPTNSPTYTPTHAPKDSTPTPTDVAISTQAIAKKFAYVRYGPGPIFRAIISVQEGDELAIVGRDNSATWLVVGLADAQNGWIEANSVNIDIDIMTLPVVVSPPTPTVAPSLTPTSRPTREPIPQPTDTLLPTIPPYP